MDLDALRNRLHEVVDDLLDEFTAAEARGHEPADTPEDVEPIGGIEPFDYRWPANYGSEHFDSGAEYKLAALENGASVIVAWTTRNAWNKDRRRAVVFYRARRGDEPNRWYPWTEFVETDTATFAAPIPDPQRPRAIARDANTLPSRFVGKTILRADAVFGSIREGGSLRLVVEKSEEAEMVRHGYWVATLRGRV